MTELGTPPEVYEYLVIGAGPAGLQMAYFLERAGRSHVVLEAAPRPGSFFETQPRHRTLLSINKVHNRYPEPEFNLRHDWNSLLSDEPELLFKNYSDALFPDAEDLVRYLRDFAAHCGPSIRYGTRVAEVRRLPEGGFQVTTDGGERLSARCVVVATGATKEHLPDDIEGFEHATTYGDHPLDAAHYANKRVAIVGAGNSAFEVANHLAGSAAMIHVLMREPVKHAWQTHFPGDLRAVNNDILDMYQLKSLHSTLGFMPKKIARKGDGSLRVWLEEDCPHWSTPCTIRLEFDYDEVILCTGWNYVPSFFAEDTRPELSECGRYPVLSPTWESSVPDLFFIGTSMAARDKKAASSFIHGFRYNVRTCFHLLEAKYGHASLGTDVTPIDEDALMALAARLVDRLSKSSGLYQMNGVLADTMVVNAEGYRFIEELPVDFIATHEEFTAADFVVSSSLEYGFKHYPASARSVDFIHPSDVFRTECAAFLHPVLRIWKRGEIVDVLHLGESLIVRYDRFFTPDTFGEGYDERFRRANEHKIANFLDRQLSLLAAPLPEQPFSEEALKRAVHPWSEEKIAAHKASLRATAERERGDEHDPRCRNE